MLIILNSLLSTPLLAQATKTNNNTPGIFDGRTPCQELAKQLNEITIPECIKIKWRLTLYKDSLHTNSGTYKMEGFVFRRDNILQGKWHISKGTQADPEAIVYQLERQGLGSLFLQKAAENVFFFLDKEKNLLVGNRNFSYALYKINEN